MLLFFHIEKTAGTTLHRIFVNNFIFYYGLKSWSIKSDDSMVFDEGKFSLIRRLAPFVTGIGGHSLRPWCDYSSICPKLKTLVFLRDPIKRYVSHYRYQKYVMGLDLEIDEFLSNPYYDNFMTSRLSKTKILDEAKNQLDEISFVGIQEYFDESLLLMRYIFQMPNMCLNYEQMNVNDQADESFDQICSNSDVFHRIKENNLLDIELYEYAVKVLYPKQKACYEPDLNADLYKLRLSNQSFVFSSVNRFLHNSLKLLYIRPIERFLLKP